MRAIVKLYKTFKCMIFPRVIDRSIPVIMRGSFMALVITLLSLQMVRSSTGNAQGILDKKISVSVSETPMVQVLDLIHEQTGVEFIYSSKARLRKNVSLNIEKERLETTQIGRASCRERVRQYV